MKRVYEAAMRVHRAQERIRALKASLEQCEPVKAWREADNALTWQQREAGVTMPPEPQFCSKAHSLHDFEPRFDSGGYEHQVPSYLTGDDAREFIAKYWCPACQRNSPKVVEIRKLSRGLASHRGTLTKMCRKAEGGEG